jgi:excisionase family DNA binding protein
MPRRKPGGERETAAIFARIPRAEAEKLQRLSYEMRRPKQEIIAGLVAQYASGTESGPMTLGRYTFRPSEAPDVLTLEQLAQFLQVAEDVALALVETGELPGRRVGDEWRFSREAVVAWLEGGGA